MSDPAPPTRVRYAVVAVTALASVLLYLDRVCFGTLEVYVRERLGLDTSSMSWVLGAFFWSYALMQVPAGWLSDRFGARRMLAVYILGWSVFTAATGLATGLVTLLAARLACGVAQAGAYPTAAGLVGRWAPLRGRGQASGIVALGGRLGGAAAPLLTALLLVAFTPAAVPSRLDEADLLDVPALCSQLQGSQDEALDRLARHIRERLPAPAVAAVNSLAPLKSHADVDPAARAELLDGLNRLVEQPDFTDGLNPSGLGLSGEALRLLKESPGQRSVAETQRLNRLVLEAACPGTLRQIYGRSWREVLVTYGAVGLLVALAFWLVVRDRPDEHPRANAAEARLIAEGQSPVPPAAGIPWRLLVRSGNMWLSGLTQFGINLGWVFLITLLPRYLIEAFHVPIEERGTMTTLPLLVACVGMFLGGRLTDWLTARLGRRRGRSLPIAGSAAVCVIIYLLCPWLPTAWAVVVALSVMALSLDLGVPSIWAFAQDIGGRNVGSAVGWGNMWGNFGAAVSPVLLTAVERAAGWPAAFVTCAAAFLVSGVAALFLDADRPLDPGPATPSPSPGG